MSRQNGEIVGKWLQAPKTTREEVQAATLEVWQPDGQYYPIAKLPETSACENREEIIEWHTRFVEVWSNVAFDFHRLIDVGDDRVLVCTTMRASGRASELQLEGDLYICAWLRNGRLTRQEDHLTLAGALDALGVEGDTLEAGGL